MARGPHDRRAARRRRRARRAAPAQGRRPAGTTGAARSASPAADESTTRSTALGRSRATRCSSSASWTSRRSCRSSSRVARTGEPPITRSPETGTTRGSSSSSVAPAPVEPEAADRAAALGERLAVAMGMVGTLTAELFLMPDGRLVVNELAPRVHNSGHWTIEGAATSQFEQHIRAICGLGLGATDALAPTAMVNLLGRGPRRDGAARPCRRPRVRRPGRPSPSLRQAAGLRTPQDGPRDGDRQHAPTRRSTRARQAAARPALGGDRDDVSRGDAATAPIVGVVGGSRSDFPVLEDAVAVLGELGVRGRAARSSRRTGRPTTCSATRRSAPGAASG